MTIEQANQYFAALPEGFAPAEELRAVLHEGEGRCSFGWYAPETDGGRLYHAEILSDRDYYYALIFDVREDAGTTYHSTEEQVFASFGLIS